jgi:adenylate cyclase
VLEGSIRKAAGRVRITGQLIDSTTGAHLWADRFDGALEDVFDLQDQITTKVVASVTPTIELAEMERAKQRATNTTGSYDEYLRGMAAFSRRQMPEARSHFQKAVEQDPDYAAAYAMSAFTYGAELASKGIIPTAKTQTDALRDAESALSMARDDAFVLARCAHPLAYVCRQVDRAMLLADKATALNPNLSVGWLARGWISIMRAEAERAIESFENLLRLSPLDPLRPFSLSGIAFAHFYLNRYDEGRRIAKEIMELYPHHQSFGAYIVNCIGAGDIAEASSTASRLLEMDPDFCVSRAANIFVILASEQRKKFDDALRSAGVPE